MKKIFKKKILICTTYFLPNVSGITVYINILAKELIKRNYEVTILTSRHENNLLKEEYVDGIKIIRLEPMIKIGKGVLMPDLLWKIVSECKKVDVINCHLPQFESFLISIWAKILGKKLILTHHTDLSFWPGLKNKFIDSVVFLSQMISGLLADYITPYTKDYANNSYYLKWFINKIKPIYPPILFEFQKDNKVTRIINNSVKSKKYVIGFCGRIAKQKGLEVLCQSTKYLNKILGKNNYVILMAGPTKIIGERYYDFLANKYPNILKDNFVFLGEIERNKLSNFYEKLNVLVLPSNDALESFGWVQIEAMKCGTPCVATNLPGMRVPIQESGWGELFEINNPKDLASKIVYVVNNEKKYYQNHMGNKLEIFNYQKSISQYEELF